jgi:predicted GNAT family acetyltransferase
MAGFSTQKLTSATWPAFDALVHEHNGVFGGCWCLSFHPKVVGLGYEQRRSAKRELVAKRQAHAALVFDGDACIGWCQFGSPAELPEIKNKKAYNATQQREPPPWRITCFFVDRHHRKQGVAAAALEGALAQIAELGGGVVEACPENTNGKMVSPTFLHAGTYAMFEQAGFTPDRQIGKNKWVVRRTVRAKRPRAG